MSSEENKNSKSTTATKVAIATAGATAYVTNAAGAVAGILGFSVPGITAGSTAAGMMSAAATSGIGGGVISTLQSVGAHDSSKCGCSLRSSYRRRILSNHSCHCCSNRSRNWCV